MFHVDVVLVVVDRSYAGFGICDMEGSGKEIADEVVGRESAGVDVNWRLEGREIVLESATVNVSVTGSERGRRAIAMDERESFGRGFDGAEVRLVDYRTVT